MVSVPQPTSPASEHVHMQVRLATHFEGCAPVCWSLASRMRTEAFMAEQARETIAQAKALAAERRHEQARKATPSSPPVKHITFPREVRMRAGTMSPVRRVGCDLCGESRLLIQLRRICARRVAR